MGAPLCCNWRLSGADWRPRRWGLLPTLGHWLHKELPLAVQQKAVNHPAGRTWDDPRSCFQWHQSSCNGLIPLPAGAQQKSVYSACPYGNKCPSQLFLPGSVAHVLLWVFAHVRADRTPVGRGLMRLPDLAETAATGCWPALTLHRLNSALCSLLARL